MAYNELALFAGAGGGILGGKLLGWNTIGAVEIEKYPRDILLQRQRDGILEPFPIWDDITTFNGKPWKGCVDIVSGGFPCQDISAAGKGEGITGERSGLWKEFARVIDEIRPRFCFVENSPMLTSRGLGAVLGDLAEMGYDARWCVLGADDAGAPHRRKRIWILGYTSMHGQPSTEERKSSDERSDNGQTREIKAGKSEGPGPSGTNEKMADAESREPREQKARDRGESFSRGSKEMADTGSHSQRTPEKLQSEQQNTIREDIGDRRCSWWDTDPADISDTNKFNDDFRRHGTSEVQRKQSGQTEVSGCEIYPRTNKRRPKGATRPTKPRLGRVAHGVAHRVDRLKGIGNGQVPGVEAIAFTILSEGLV